jgi:phage baseplate assembly protein W
MSQYNFKNSGRSIEELNKKIRRQDFLEKEQKLPIGIVLPLRSGTKSKETLFSMTHDENEQVKINLKNLILTKKGEYLGRPNFGTNLIELYNTSNLENIDSIVMDEIKSAVSIFMPFLGLQNFESFFVNATENNSPYYDITVKYLFNNIENNVNIKLQVSR